MEEDRILVVSGTCPKCGHVKTSILEKVKDKLREICPAHGAQDFRVMTGAMRSREEAEEIMKGGIF